MTLQDARQGGADWIEFGVIEVGYAVRGGVTGREQHLVSFPKRNLERFGEAHDHRPARDGPTAFDKADVPLGGCRAPGKLKLADAAASAPLPHRGRKPAPRRVPGHPARLTLTRAVAHSLQGIASLHCRRKSLENDWIFLPF